MKVKLHPYKFDLSNKNENAAYHALSKTLREKGLSLFRAWSGATPDRELASTVEETIDATHIFENQYNTESARRFDWKEDAHPHLPKRLVVGYWSELPVEFLELRRQTEKCGYCGALYGPRHAKKEDETFCLACLASPYLKESELLLLRLRKVSEKHTDSSPLTTEERDYLIPLFLEAKRNGALKREEEKLAKIKAKVEGKIEEARQKAEKLMESAKNEQAGLQWLLDRGFAGVIDNVIYYDHLQAFGFGWRSPLSEIVASDLLDVLSEFPFRYEIQIEGQGKKKNF